MNNSGNLFVVFTQPAVSATEFDSSLRNTASISINIPFSPTSVAVDPNGALWLAGSHSLVKLAPSGVPAVSIELGGAAAGTTVASALAIDESGNVYVAGETSQADFPVTPGAFEGFPANPPANFAAGFLTKFSNSGTRLLSTLVQGAAPAAIAVDSSGAITLAGTTPGADFPVTANAPQSVCNCEYGGHNAFLTRLSADFGSLIWSTFLGGDPPYDGGSWTMVSGIALEPDGGAVVVGATWDRDFPVTPGAIETVLPAQAGGVVPQHGFITRINATGTAWIFSTYLGGSVSDSISGVQTDSQGNIWITGSTDSPDFPALAGTLQLGGALVYELAADGSHLLCSERIPGVWSEETMDQAQIWINPDGTLTVLGSQVGNLAAPGDSSVLLLLPAGPVEGISLLGIADSASTLTGGEVAPGEFLSIYGTGLGPAVGAGAALDSSGRIASRIAGTSVLFDGKEAPLLWVSANQINLLVPYGIADQASTTMQVFTTAGSSHTLDLTVIPTEPNVFVIVNADGTVNDENHPAVAGSIITLYASGAGVLNQSLPDGTLAGTPPPSPAAHVSVALLMDAGYMGCADYPENLLYAGASPGLVVNAIQVNFQFQMPPPILNGCLPSREIWLTVGSGISQAALYW